VPSIEDPPEWLCSNWKWCKYEVVDVVETFPGEECPLEPGEIFCFGCAEDQDDCNLAKGKQTPDDDPFRVFETPEEENPLCDVTLKSLRTHCGEECRGHHFGSPVPTEQK
jgi:hypothetical protein